MSFYKQPLTYQCGPFALKYALVMLGSMEDENEIEKIAGTSWWYGTDEIGLERAAKHYNCEFVHINNLAQLNNALLKNLPVILCVDSWSHWITVITHEKNKYICVDSENKKVIITLTEEQLLHRWLYDNQYAGYILKPLYKNRSYAKFTIKKARALMSDKYENLAVNWDNYFEIISTIGRIRNTNAFNIITFEQFSKKYQKQIVDSIVEWNSSKTVKELNNIFKNILFIADTYNMIIHNNDIDNAIINLSIILNINDFNL